MNINQLIDNALAIKDFNSAKVFKEILNISNENNISINDAIQYLIEQKPSKFKMNLLRLAQRFYPTKNTNIDISKKINESLINIITNKTNNVQPEPSYRLYIRRDNKNKTENKNKIDKI
jgi:hypothetical protein